MENSGNNSTHDKSSNIQNEIDSNMSPGRVTRVTRTTLPPANFNHQKFDPNFILDENNKNNESLPIKGNISNFNFKIVLIGNVAVGKSSIIKRFIHNDFNKSYLCTVGTELSRKSLLIGGNKRANLLIWDTCGQEKFRAVTRQYYRDTHAIILVFDLTNGKTFKDLNSWLEEAINYINNTKCLFFVLGNKSDETEKIVVTNEQNEEDKKRLNQLINQQAKTAGQIASLGAQIAVNSAQQNINQAQAHIDHKTNELINKGQQMKNQIEANVNNQINEGKQAYELEKQKARAKAESMRQEVHNQKEQIKATAKSMKEKANNAIIDGTNKVNNAIIDGTNKVNNAIIDGTNQVNNAIIQGQIAAIEGAQQALDAQQQIIDQQQQILDEQEGELEEADIQ